MAVTSPDSQTDYEGNGVTDSFPTGFYFQANSEVVAKYTPSGGPEVTWVEGVDYTLTGAGDEAGGTLVATTPPAASSTLVLERTVPFTQPVDLQAQGAFSPEVHEDALDRLTFLTQQLDRRLSDVEGGVDTGDLEVGNGLDLVGTMLDLVEDPDGSIDVTADGIAVGVLATDAQHGVRGGGTQHAAATAGAAGFMSAADKTKLDALPAAAADEAVTITAGAGLTGGGDLSANRTIDAVAHADGSIVVNANDIQVGVLATDAQHGVRGGGTQHAVATTGAAGFMSAADKTALDAIAVGVITEGSVTTSDATVTKVASFTPDDDTAETFDVMIVGKTQSGAEGAGYGWGVTVRRSGGSTALIGAPTALWTHEDAAGWATSITVASPQVNINVTGAAGTDIDWSCIVRRRSAP